MQYGITKGLPSTPSGASFANKPPLNKETNAGVASHLDLIADKAEFGTLRSIEAK
jgi:hypothetical protein